jgi:hypothetical protein
MNPVFDFDTGFSSCGKARIWNSNAHNNKTLYKKIFFNKTIDKKWCAKLDK